MVHCRRLLGLLMASASAKHVVMKMVPTKVVRHKRSHTASMDKLGNARERGVSRARRRSTESWLAMEGCPLRQAAVGGGRQVGMGQWKVYAGGRLARSRADEMRIE